METIEKLEAEKKNLQKKLKEVQMLINSIKINKIKKDK